MNVSSSLLQAPVDISELNDYIMRVMSIPLLEKEEEYQLAKEWIEEKKISSANKLVVSHLKLVVRIAMNYKRYGISMLDIISEGTIGLINAVRSFDPSKGFRLATYAIWKIKASINEYVLKSWSLVKIATTKAQRKLFFGLSKAKKKIKIFESQSHHLTEEQIRQISDHMNVQKEEVCEMNARINLKDCSIEIEDSENSEKSSLVKSDSLISESSELQYINQKTSSYRKELMNSAIASLTEREKEVILSRSLKIKPETLDALGKRLNVSAERVRQIQANSIKKIKAYIKTKVGSSLDLII